MFLYIRLQSSFQNYNYANYNFAANVRYLLKSRIKNTLLKRGSIMKENAFHCPIISNDKHVMPSRNRDIISYESFKFNVKKYYYWNKTEYFIVFFFFC